MPLSVSLGFSFSLVLLRPKIHSSIVFLAITQSRDDIVANIFFLAYLYPYATLNTHKFNSSAATTSKTLQPPVLPMMYDYRRKEYSPHRGSDRSQLSKMG